MIPKDFKNKLCQTLPTIFRDVTVIGTVYSVVPALVRVEYCSPEVKAHNKWIYIPENWDQKGRQEINSIELKQDPPSPPAGNPPAGNPPPPQDPQPGPSGTSGTERTTESGGVKRTNPVSPAGAKSPKKARKTSGRGRGNQPQPDNHPDLNERRASALALRRVCALAYMDVVTRLR